MEHRPTDSGPSGLVHDGCQPSLEPGVLCLSAGGQDGPAGPDTGGEGGGPSAVQSGSSAGGGVVRRPARVRTSGELSPPLSPVSAVRGSLPDGGLLPVGPPPPNQLPGRGKRVRNWCWTLNNPTPNGLLHCRSLGEQCKYIAFQGERGGNTGTPHLQGVICFEHPQELSGVRRRFWPLGPHLEPMHGTIEQAVAYCQKEETADPEIPFWEAGTRPVGQGARGDLTDVVRAIRAGGSVRQVFDAGEEQFIKYHRGITASISLLHRPRNHVTAVYWLYGGTGSGKSLYALQQSSGEETTYWKSPGDHWWDGYEGQQDVVIDDYRADFCKFSELLRLFDRYPHRVQYKGGIVQFTSKRIFVTTPKSPQETWASRTAEDLGQLMRRITEVIRFPRDAPPVVPAMFVPGFVPPP